MLQQVGHFLLQEIVPSQGSDPHFLYLLHRQAGSLLRAPPRKPIAMSSLVFKNYRLLDRARRFITLLKIDDVCCDLFLHSILHTVFKNNE